MKVVFTEVLSDVAPHQTRAGRSGMAYAAGEELVVYEEAGKYYYFLDCVSKDGLAYETDDQGPFDTLEEALEAALDFVEWPEVQVEKIIL